LGGTVSTTKGGSLSLGPPVGLPILAQEQASRIIRIII